MKTETFLWIISISFGILTFFGWILHFDEQPSLKKRIGKVIYNISWRLAVIPLFFVLYEFNDKNYDLSSTQDFWLKYDLPLVDTFMPLTHLNKSFALYSSISDKPIRHQQKWMKYDVFDVYECEDIFINEIEDLKLSIEFIKPNILRDSSRLILLQPIGKNSWEDIDSLSLSQSDSVLQAWGLLEITKTKLTRY